MSKKLVFETMTESRVKNMDFRVIKNIARLQTMPNKIQPVAPLKIVKQNGVYVPAMRR